MFSMVIAANTNLRDIQPVICRSDIAAPLAQLLRNFGHNKSLADGIDPENSDEKSAVGGNAGPRQRDSRRGFADRFVMAEAR